jgi:hypothetical protein
MNIFFLFFINIGIINGFAFDSINIKTQFNNIPFNHGLRHLHMPEHISETHKLSVPLFAIKDVYKATYYNNIPTIEFKTLLLNSINFDVKMICKYTNRCEIIFYKSHITLFALQFTIIPNLYDKNSHFLYIKAYFPYFYLSILFKPLIYIAFYFILIISKYEDIFFLYLNKKSNIIYNKNFNEYRKLIFKK